MHQEARASQGARAGPGVALAWCVGCLLATRTGAAAPAEVGQAADVGEAPATDAGEAREPAPATDVGEAGEPARKRDAEGPRALPAMSFEGGSGTASVQLERGRGDGEPRLEPIGGGRLRYRDPRFTAIVAADGSVEFRDHKGKVDTNVLGLDVVKRKLDRKPFGAPDIFTERALNPDPRLPQTAILAGFGGRFGGLADWTIKTRHAAAKSKFLAQTEGLRMRMGHAWLQARLAEQLEASISRAIALWRDPSVALAERKRRLFAAWDECEAAASEGPTAEIRAEAAARARARLEALIRVLAPPGSPQQFTAEELAELNAGRRSRAVFAPYRGAQRRALPLRPRAGRPTAP